MANANDRHLRSVAAGGTPPGQRLDQMAALLSDPGKITPALLRIRLWAICTDQEVPTGRKNFVDFVMQIGIPKAVAYRTWAETYGVEVEQDADSPEVVTIRKVDKRPPVWTVPPAPTRVTALYRWYDEDDRLLYIGISDELSGRITNHIDGSSWMDFAVRSTIERYPSRAEASAAEVDAIKAERPLFNQKHNGSTEARRRLVAYLVEHDRLDLLAPSVSRG